MRKFVAELRRRNVLRVALAYLAGAWLLIQVLETVFPIFDLPPLYIRWVIIALTILFVPALALSWAFEWSARGIRTQEAADRKEPATADRRSFDRAVIAVLSLALLYFAVDKFLLPQLLGGAASEATVAVLPFTDLSEGESAAYIGDGVAEDILSMLSRNPELRVAARRSSFSFRGSALPIADIARQLGVAYVLDGSVRVVGERVRINVELVSASDGYGVWSEAYERGLDELFGVKNSILDATERALGVTSTLDTASARAPDPEAFVLTLRANYLSSDGTVDGMQQAVELYERALELDPDLASAWVNLATTQANRTMAGYVPFEDGYRQARDAAVRAIAVDPDHAGAYKALSLINRYFEGNMALAIENMRRALEAEPTNVAVLEDAGTLLMNIGELEQAVRLQEYLVRLSPVDSITRWNLALRYRYADRLEDSIRVFRETIELSPDRAGNNYHLGESLLLTGRHREALALFETEEDEAYRLKGLALAHHALGSGNAADEALNELVRAYGDQWPSEIAHVYAYRGETDEAFAWLEREYDTYGPGGWGEWQLQRLYDNLRDDPRWYAFLAKTGTGPEQLSRYELELPPDLL